MSKKKLLLPSINKWVLFTSLGMIAAASYGIVEWWNQQSFEHKSFSSFPQLNEISTNTVEEDVVEESAETEESLSVTTTTEEVKAPAVETTPEPVPTPTPSAQTSATPQQIVKVEKVKDEYPIDQKYLSKVGRNSIAYKFQDYMVLSPSNADIWKKKAKKLKAETQKRTDKMVATYWYGYWREDDIDAESTHKLCTNASSYTESGTSWSLFFPGKTYFDFLWNICGREDKPKPDNWWYK